ncbi:NfeD family protein [Singulisphaera sp. Ch08]|uniref:NfeD family protein n=1 Tax=Singulisphaera sp. Ch08 TaxID=3120278 RepID=A0AAU7CFW9_9BACT
MSTLAWPLLLLAFGLILLIAEVFIPSGGLIGLLALCCIALSLWRAFEQSTELGLIFLLADFLLMPLVVALGVYLWPRTPLGKRVLLKPPDPEDIEASHSSQRLDHLVGQLGRALTPLRPSGMVDFDGRRLDGLAEEGLIPPGSLIQAVRVRGGQLIVRTAHDPTLEEVLVKPAPAPEPETNPADLF